MDIRITTALSCIAASTKVSFISLVGVLVLASPAHGTPSESVLYTFSGPDGSAPSAVAEAEGGKIFGATASGGVNNLGTLFELTRSGTLTTLYSFSGNDGAAPNSLIAGPDGDFYGTTTSGGAQNQGTIFKLTADGVFKSIYSFNGADGGAPNPLIFGSDSQMYGTTAEGGTTGNGVIFRINKKGTAYKLLHTFSGTDGSLPGGALLQASDGMFYGVASGGGASGFGSIFKISRDGLFTILVSDGSMVGGEPIGALLEGPDGNFYGVATSSYGYFYRMTPTGATTTLYQLPQRSGDAAGFQTGLVFDDAGNLYGTNTFGGEFAYGAFVKFSLSGSLTHLRALQPGSDGTLFGPLIRLSNGHFLGAGAVGGVNGQGVVEEFSPKPIPPTLTFFTSSAGVSLSQDPTTQLTWYASDSDTCVASDAWSGQQGTGLYNALGLTFTSPGNYKYKLTCEGDGGSITKHITVTVTN